MSRHSKSAVRRYHDRVARRYDSIYEDAYWKLHDALTWDYIKPHLPDDQSLPVLDLGCGTGKWAIRLLKSGYTVTCVDISGAMIEQARRKIEAAIEKPRVEFLQADLCKLNALPGSAFTLALAMGDPIGCTSSPARAVKQISRCLTGGGILIATLDNRLAALDFYMQSGSLQKLKTFLRTGKTHWLTRDRDEQFEIHTYTPGQARRLFTNAGFEVIEIIGKTVLPFRASRGALEDSDMRRQWQAVEKSLARDPDAIGRAAHLQITARKPG